MQNKTSSAFTVRRMAITGLLAALVFVFSWMQIPIGSIARIHLGNVFCALAGLLFGPLTGGLAGGFGSMLFDLTNPAYIAECWITFLTKFFIGFIAGLIAHPNKKVSVGRDTVSYTHLADCRSRLAQQGILRQNWRDQALHPLQ